jgi:ornithine cyclodeaminase/alanine dehydrogenase-like protein (mu-crystallin family)
VTLFISESDVRASMDVTSLVRHLAHRLASSTGADPVTGPRANITLGRAFVRLGGAIAPGTPGVLGYKAFHAGTDGGVRYLIVLADLSSGRVLALVDADHLTAVRTGAVTAVATEVMAPPDVERIAVVGSGEEAWSNLVAVCGVRQAKSIRVFSPRAARREAFAARVRSELGIEASPSDGAAEAVRDAGVVIVATNTRRLADPIAFLSSWVQPGMHINSIGSTTPALRELDAQVLVEADAVVFDTVEGSTQESGDVQAALASGFDIGSARELGAVLAGGTPVRTSADDVTVFKSVGTAIQDIVTAEWVLAECRGRGLGTEIELDVSEKKMEL